MPWVVATGGDHFTPDTQHWLLRGMVMSSFSQQLASWPSTPGRT
jgi:hypothetical protein